MRTHRNDDGSHRHLAPHEVYAHLINHHGTRAEIDAHIAAISDDELNRARTWTRDPDPAIDRAILLHQRIRHP